MLADAWHDGSMLVFVLCGAAVVAILLTSKPKSR